MRSSASPAPRRSSAAMSQSSAHTSAGARRRPPGNTASAGASAWSPRTIERPPAEVDPLRLHPGSVERRDDAVADGVAEEGGLHLAVDALEALLGEAEAGGVLVETLEHRLQGRLGLLAAQAVDPQPARGARAELEAGTVAGGQLAEALPAPADEGAGAWLVAVEDGAAAVALVDYVELDLRARLDVIAEERRGLEREVPQRVVKSTIAHEARFR